MYLTYTSRMMECRRDGYEEGREDGISIGLERGRLEGLERGRLEGLERGAHQNKLETAKSFLAEGLHPEIIARCTNLPLETVLELVQAKYNLLQKPYLGKLLQKNLTFLPQKRQILQV